MEKTKIEWCDSSWNPVTGCYHTCPYCYARRTANRFKGCNASPDGSTASRFVVLEDRPQYTDKLGTSHSAAYPYGFVPTYHKYRIDDLKTRKFGQNIFVCSMADLFGDWVPVDVILEVFNACREHDEHRYLFLTKNPARYYSLASLGLLPKMKNFWYGTTVEDQDQDYFFSEEHHTFLSIEPIMAPFDSRECFDQNIKPDWIIIGAETGKRENKVIPERSWVEPIVETGRRISVPIFMKDSLIPIWGENIITEFPWG